VFLFQETYYVRPGLQDVIDGRVRSLHENHITNPAGAAMDWAKFCGDATTYLAFRLWHDREVEWDAEHAAWMAEYNRTRPDNSFIAPPDIEFFEQVAQRGETGGASLLVTCDVSVGGATRGAFNTFENELTQRLESNAGFGEYRMYRFMGGEHRYLRCEFWRDVAAGLAFWRDASMRDFSATLTGLREAPRFRYYDVLHQVGSAKPR
jgi:quinol monooxygenase YgiN